MMETGIENKILDAISKLSFQIDKLHKATIAEPYSSVELKDLFTALSKAQGEYKTIGNNRDNPYFKSKYADLDEIIQAARPALAKYGLAFVQQIRLTEEGATVLHSILSHASGQWLESRSRIIPPKNDPQSYGSTLTYHRRYSAVALLGVTISNDMHDDDAEVAMTETRDVYTKGTAVNTKYDPRDQSLEVISKDQLDELYYELSPEYADIAQQVLEGLNLRTLADMPKSKYKISIDRIRQIKNVRMGIK